MDTKSVFIIVFSVIFWNGYSQSKSDCIPIEDSYNGIKVLKVADKMPRYPGGQQRLYTDFLKRLKYPKEQQEIQAKIHMTFIIDIKGRIRNECIYKRFRDTRISPLEQTALKIIKSLPRWIPG